MAAVTVTGAVLVQQGPDGTATPGSPATVAITTGARAAATAPAGTVLLQLASAALSGAPTPDGAGVAYTATRDAMRIGDLSVLTTSTTELWKASDGSGRLVTASESTTDPLTEGDDSWGPGQSPDGGALVAGKLRGLRVADLSTDPAVLARQVADWATARPLMTGNAGPGTVADSELDLVAALLSEPSATPAQRAAAFTALSQRSDVGLLGQHTDPLGRVGTAVEHNLVNGATWRVTLTFDPATSTLLAHESTLVGRGDQQWLADVPLGPWSWTATTAAWMVDAVGDTTGAVG